MPLCFSKNAGNNTLLIVNETSPAEDAPGYPGAPWGDGNRLRLCGLQKMRKGRGAEGNYL